MAGKVYLVGAGPGDPDLITLKGLFALNNADVVLYDYLAPVELLLRAKEDAEIICTGKRSGHTELSQDEINSLIYSKALEGKSVVRLKGGDPIIFGRGAEEAIYLKEKGIEFEIIPGVTAAFGASSFAGIPLTHRGLSSAVAFITGHEDIEKGQSAIDWSALAKFRGTLVFYMGVSHLSQIINKLIENGRDGNEPSALVGRVTTGKQYVVEGALKDLPNLTKECEPPALLLIGKVVSLRKRFNWYEGKPLFGHTIAVCRPLPDALDLSAKLRSLGGDAFAFPTITFKEPSDYKALDSAIHPINQFDWLLFMSKRGIEYFFHRLNQIGRDLREFPFSRIGAIGSETANELSKHKIRVDLIPSDYTSEGFLKEFAKMSAKKRGKKFLLLRTNSENDVLPQGLKELGAEVVEVEVYQTIPYPKKRLEHLFDKLNQANAIIFTSSLGFKYFLELLNEKAQEILNKVTIVALGSTTAGFIKQNGYNVDIVPPEPTQDSLLEEIVKILGKTKSK